MPHHEQERPVDPDHQRFAHIAVQRQRPHHHAGGRSALQSVLVDGQPVAEGRLGAPVRTPNDAMEVGADLGSPVLGESRGPGFVGRIESVRIYSGVAP